MEQRWTTPVAQKDIRKAHVGDVVFLSGTVVTVRDAAHQKLLSLTTKSLPFTFSEAALYHCGPLVKKTGNAWTVLSAGPTTSSRMNTVEPEIIKRYGVRVIIGKGGMDTRTGQALKKHQVVYLAFPGGAGVVAADAVEHVDNVYWLDELGMTEAIWVFTVKDFGPLVVAMDSYGKTLYKK